MDGSGVETGGVKGIGVWLPGGPNGGMIKVGGELDGGEPESVGGVDVEPVGSPNGGTKSVGTPMNVSSGGT